MTDAASRFASMNRWLARALLLLLIAAMAAPLIQTQAPVPPRTGAADDNADVHLYEHIVDRVRAGGNYYAVAADAQRKGGYPLKPFVTMRLPTLALFQASLPNRTAIQIAFWMLFAATIAAWVARLRALALPARRVALGGLLVLAGAATLSIPDLLVWHEAWAALLIALSLALRSDRRFALAALTGLLAVAIREIAIVYPLVMAATALIDRRKGETLAWSAVIAAALAFVAWHASQVALVVRPDDLASPGWSSAGGWRFVATMLWLTGPLRLWPFALASILIPLALIGWAGWRSATGLRGSLLLAAYVAAFALFGRVDNFYWGFLIAPLLPLGLLFAPTALTDLARAAR